MGDDDCRNALIAIETAAEVLVLRAKVTEAYAQGRADERADVVAWLRGRGYVSAAETLRQIKRGEHVDAAKVKP